MERIDIMYLILKLEYADNCIVKVIATNMDWN
jgi:hypothetical protein